MAPPLERDAAGIQQWHRELLRYAHRLTGDTDLAEDVVQEAMLRLLRSGPDPAEPHARAWLYRVVTNIVRDHARRHAMMRRRPIPVDADAPRTPEQDTERSETVAQVRAALARLAPRDRELLMLRESGFRHREIAEIIEVSASSVSVLVYRALQRFRAAYLQEVPE